MTAKAMIVGCAGEALSADENAFLADERPWGLILFARNLGDPGTIADLTASFRERVGRPDAPVLIDQEGGRVQRLGPPGWTAYPAAGAVAAAAGGRMADAERLAWGHGRLLAGDLAPLGITVDCLPVLDVSFPETHAIIGDRSFGDDPEIVARLARAQVKGLMDGGVLPVMKHIPGHGRATVDSHLALPRVDASKAELDRFDFAPFRALAPDVMMAMTAHVVYTAIDPDRPATTSPKVIHEVIRRNIGFDGLLMTDDLSMKALAGRLEDRARAAFDAGCDLALHCNGDMSEMQAIAAATPELAGRAAERAAAALESRRAETVDDLAAIRRDLETALSSTA